MTNWSQYVGKRLLVTDAMTHIGIDERVLEEVSPSGKRGKFRTDYNTTFWWALGDLEVLEVLPTEEGKWVETKGGRK